MALTSTQRAYLTCRSGLARSGAVRSGFAPRKTQGATPGSAGGFYIWRRVERPTTTWVKVQV
jgi:hypothetical protein